MGLPAAPVLLRRDQDNYQLDTIFFPVFGATHSGNVDLELFDGVDISLSNSFGTTDSGLYHKGIFLRFQQIPLEGFTSSTDTLYVLDQFQPTNYPVIPAPLTFGYTSSTSFMTVDSLELTLKNLFFNYNRKPVQRQLFATVEHNALGYGDIVMPYPGGGTSDTLEVLLLQTTVYTRTHFLIDGEEPSDLILTIFPIEQDVLDTVVSYSFLRKDHYLPLLRITENEHLILMSTMMKT